MVRKHSYVRLMKTQLYCAQFFCASIDAQQDWFLIFQFFLGFSSFYGRYEMRNKSNQCEQRNYPRVATLSSMEATYCSCLSNSQNCS